MTARILDGLGLSKTIREEIRLEVASFRETHPYPPKLAAVLVGEDPASAVYVRNKRLACEQAGMQSELISLPATTTTSELLDVIGRLNLDSSVHGILVQLPLPKGINTEQILDAVAAEKDVDCFHPENVGLLFQGRPRFIPCTPHGVQQILSRNGIETAGAHVVILGRSEIVGKPLGMLLLQKGPAANATVTICHSQSRNLETITRSADILVAALGRPRFVGASHVRPGAVVIDVGINREGDKLVGDVDFEAVAAVASAITPVPKGIGPMTIAMLLANTLKAARLGRRL